ncbi:MAG TPA: MBL fold metallo-hydrolase, partial [Actinomycetota bacterium]|nr:MBL fold metallo-hydrolase [Actinomycetota bacterium]
DHYGLVPTIRKLSGAEAFMGAHEIARLLDQRTKWELGRLLLEAGFPRDLLNEMAERDRQLLKVHQVTQLECKPIQDGDIFEFDDFMLMAISLPGHTGGHLGFLEPATGSMFAGDTLLPHFSPNPLLEPILEPEGEAPSSRRRSLKQYLESLDKLESLDLNVVYPGHGPVITDPGRTIQYMREHHMRRLEVVWDRLDEQTLRGEAELQRILGIDRVYARVDKGHRLRHDGVRVDWSHRIGRGQRQYLDRKRSLG